MKIRNKNNKWEELTFQYNENNKKLLYIITDYVNFEIINLE